MLASGANPGESSGGRGSSLQLHIQAPESANTDTQLSLQKE